MDLVRLTGLLRRRFLYLVLGALLGAGLGYGVSRLLTPSYSAAATLLVFQTSSVGNAQLGDLMASQQLAHTYADLLTRHPVLSQTIAELHLPLTPDQLAAQVSVALVRDTQLLEVHVTDHDPARAAAIANKLVTVFVSQVHTLQTQSFADVQTRLDADLGANEVRLQDAQRQLDTLKAVAAPTTAQRADLVRLTGLVTQYTATRDNLLNSAAQLRQSEATSGTPLQVAETAEVPQIPVFPRTSLNVALATLAGLLLGAGLAWAREYFNDTLESPEAVQAALALPTLAPVRHSGRRGVASHTRRVQPGAGPAALLARDDGRSETAESYRLLRTNIEFSSLDHPPRRLLVTSAAPGEGKSTVAANLAVVLAQSGKRVLLIDGDLRRPSVGRIFGLANTRGLTTLLLADTPAGGALGEAIVPAPGVENLSLLPSGPLPPNPADLLGSQRLAALLDDLSARYDLLVIDSPPTLVATDPLVLARQVDGVLLVISAGETRAPLVRAAGAAIRQVGGHLLGVVLNKVGESSARPYYAYYSGDPAPATPDAHPAADAAPPAEPGRSTSGAPLRLR